MFYACLATIFCFSVGVTGITLALIDIQRYNFGLYLALLSVVGTTVSVAFWIISPRMCAEPRCVQWIFNKYGYKLEPIQEAIRIHCLRQKRRFWEDDSSDGPNKSNIYKRNSAGGRAIRCKRAKVIYGERPSRVNTTPRPSIVVAGRKLSHSRSMPHTPVAISMA